MMKYKFIVNPQAKDILEFSKRVQDAEIREIKAFYADASILFRLICERLEHGLCTITGIYCDDVLICIYGIDENGIDENGIDENGIDENANKNEGTPPKGIPPTGIPWMFSTDMSKHKRLIAMFAKKMLDSAFKKYFYLENYIGSWNINGINCLKHLGFTIDEEKEIVLGRNGEVFYKFHISACF